MDIMNDCVNEIRIDGWKIGIIEYWIVINDWIGEDREWMDGEKDDNLAIEMWMRE